MTDYAVQLLALFSATAAISLTAIAVFSPDPDARNRARTLLLTLLGRHGRGR